MYCKIQVLKVLAKSSSIKADIIIHVSWMLLACLDTCYFHLGLELLPSSI